MKGIYHLWVEGNDLGYHISENLEELDDDIKNSRNIGKHLTSYIIKHPGVELKYEIVKETVPREVPALYMWVQV